MWRVVENAVPGPVRPRMVHPGAAKGLQPAGSPPWGPQGLYPGAPAGQDLQAIAHRRSAARCRDPHAAAVIGLLLFERQGMKILITASEAMDRCDWDEFCSEVGLSVWALRDGMDGETEFTLTEAQAAKLGLRIRDESED